MMNKSEIKERALTENTAQGVFKHLNDLESNRERMSSRWIWELLQNARDAANGKPATLVASVEHTEGELAFLHNGSGFTNDQVAHLIYHGSTKFELEDTIGQFGSGFLTTHLLSSQIDVSGFLNTGQSFEFRLERATGSIKSLGELMDKAWEDFNPSDNPLTVDMPTEFTTRFAYTIGDDAADAVEKGIATLKQCAPYVVVFNPEFSAISIKSVTGNANFNVTDRKQLNENGLQLVTVVETDGGTQLERQYLVASGEKSSVAFPLESVEGVSVCLPVDDTPRLFLGFPLVGTENFSFPAVINSFRFAPTENRDGVYLWRGSNQANTENEAVIEEACKLLVSLLQFAASSGWRNAYLLAEIPDLQSQSWLNSEQLRECLKERLIEVIRQTPAVLNESGEAMPPKESQLPIADTAEGAVRLWDLLVGWEKNQDIWPRRDEAAGWCNAVTSWAKLSNCEASAFDRAIDGRILASVVDEVSHDPSVADPRTHRLSRLTLKEGISVISWLDRLIGFLIDNELGRVIHEYRVVPSQEGFLRILPNLHRDQQISEELKDVAGLLGWRIRCELRDTRLDSLAEEVGAGDWDNDYVLGELIKKLRERAEKTPDTVFADASVRIFAWITRQRKWNLIQDFPVFSDEPDSPQRRVIKLERAKDDVPGLLAPVPTWSLDLQQFSELFPRRYTLSNAFFEVASDPATWQTLEAEGFLKRDVMITRSLYFGTFLPDEPLPDNEDEDHETSEHVDVTDVAFITRDDIGIMARVRQSQRLARIFWQFLTEWLIIHDSDGLEVKEALCDCGNNHHYYSAEWLEPLVRNRWVPVGGDRRVQLTAQSLASLLRDSGWDPNSLNENPATVKLLKVVGVTQFDLMRELVSENAEARAEVDGAFTDILTTAGGNVSKLAYVPQYLEDLKDDEDLPEFLAKRREQRRLVHENQNLGGKVEELVKQSLEGEGFTVQRTGVGSDFKIEYDDVTSLKLARSGQTWLVEVKATRDNRVRMTDTQARTAAEKGDGFLLCVVPVEGETSALELDDVRNTMRFVANIGPRVAPLCNDLEGFRELREEITAGESAGVQLEVEAGAIRVSVANSVWQNEGFPLAELPNRLK